MRRSFEQWQTKTFLPGGEQHGVRHHVKAMQLPFVNIEELVDPTYQSLNLQISCQSFQPCKMVARWTDYGISGAPEMSNRT